MPTKESFDPLKALAELTEMNRKVAEAARRLATVHDADVRIATLPVEPVHRIDQKVLYRCPPPERRRTEVPLLVVYALVGRYTVLDLQEDRSFLRNLVAAGLDVYVIDWGHPGRADRYDDMSDYVEGYLAEFVDRIRARHDLPSINLLGICQGGVLSLCYAALHPDKVRNLVTAVTPVDFHADQVEGRVDHGFMNVWVRNLQADDIDLMIEGLGNVPGDVGGIAFSMMTPLRSLSKYNLALVDAGQDDAKLLNFLRMEKWLADRPAHPGEVARQWLKDLYQENRLVKGSFELDGRPVRLDELTMPILNLYTETDHIIPPKMSTALRRHVGSTDYTEVAIPGGHIGVFVGGRGQALMKQAIADWLAVH